MFFLYYSSLQWGSPLAFVIIILHPLQRVLTGRRILQFVTR